MDDAAARDNQYRYNGKELNTDFGLGWYDYGARWYDATLGRWGAVDPMADMTWTMNPYHYVSNNPVKFIDPFGLFQVTYGKDGEASANQYFENKQREFEQSTFYQQVQRVVQSIDKPCPECIKKGEAIPGTNNRADADETPITRSSQTMIWMAGSERPVQHKSSLFSNLSLEADANAVLGTTGGVLELNKYKNISLSSNWKIYPNGWNGNQYVSVTKLGHYGNVLGKTTLYTGILIDAYQYATGYQSGEKTVLNVAVGLACFATGGPAGLAIGIVYFGLDKAGVIDHVLEKIHEPEPNPSVFDKE